MITTLISLFVGGIIGIVIAACFAVIERKYYLSTNFGERHPFLVLNIAIIIVAALIVLEICLCICV